MVQVRVSIRYGLALCIVLAAMFLRHGIVMAFGELPPFITFFPAVALAAMLLGARAGILATFLSAIMVDCFLMHPHYGFTVVNPAEALALGLFTVAGLLMSWTAGLLGQSRRREAEAALRQSEARLSLQVFNKNYGYI